MVLGTHNSWSFGKPTNILLRPFWFIAKCQDLPIEHQYLMNSKIFDLRVWFDKKGDYKIRHGIMSFKNSLYKDLRFLNSMEDCWVRVILESNSEPKDLNHQKSCFYKFCSGLEDMFPNIKFFGGEGKWNWIKLYQFKNEDYPLIDKYSSTTSYFKLNCLRILDDWYPRLYAKKYNRTNYEQFKELDDDSCLFIDFINYVSNSNK